jgi:Tol biopolymer transport system component
MIDTPRRFARPHRLQMGSQLFWVLAVASSLIAPSAQVAPAVPAANRLAARPANGDSVSPAISADGRFVAFESTASNLVAGDTNESTDVFVRDRVAGTTERVGVASDGAQANSDSYSPVISADGRFVAFESLASNLVVGDTNGSGDVFVRDRVAGTTERVGVASGGAQANRDSLSPAVSADGRFVAFESTASNLVAGDTNSTRDVFVRDRVAATTERVSVGSDGAQANGYSLLPAISADGRFVAFESYASNLVAGDTNESTDVFVRDRVAATTERVSVADSLSPVISADGRFVAFASYASNLVAGDTNGSRDVFVRDRVAGTTERVSVASGGAQANRDSHRAVISADGRFVAFLSTASNLVAGDTNGSGDVFVRDRVAATTTLVSVGRKLTVRAGALLLQPWPARAGKRLNATMAVSASGAPVASARVLCAATLAGRKLPVSARSFRAGRARCVWQIPADTRGKQLKGSLTATTADGTASRYFVGIVR